VGLVLALGGCASTSAPPPVAASGAPRFPEFIAPDVPASLRVLPDVRERQDRAWARLQAGDLGGASREYADLLKRTPDFYPAEAGLGYVSLADRQFKQAAAHFGAALGQDPRYLPALTGQAESRAGLHDDAAAIAGFEAVLSIDPSRESVRARLDAVRLRVVQSAMDSSRRAKDAGRLDEAQAILERAMASSSGAAVLLRELAGVESARGSLDPAETHVRRSIQLDPGDAEALAVLGGILEARGRLREAADAYSRAGAIDPRPVWRDKSESLKSRATAASIPPEYRSIPAAPAVTRGQVAAVIALRLGGVLDRATKVVTAVATDVRGHWAAAWIATVTQSGVMDVFPNHTFQAGAPVRRTELAQIVERLVTLFATRRADDLVRWRAARPRFADLALGHLSYSAAAIAVSCGAMTVAAGDRFWPTRTASGAELMAAVARIEQLAGR
jgi:tetratricopeptide (TPR) repeat protein